MPVLLLLPANGHLPIGSKERHLAPLGMERLADRIHLRIMELARGIELLQGRVVQGAAPIEAYLQLGELEVAIDWVWVSRE